MSNDNKDVKLSLTVMVSKEENKVLFAVADNHFADILLSFLTLPLGIILKVFEKHYGEEAPTIGSLSSLYQSVANLDTTHFVTEGAKLALLHPRSSFEAEYERLKVDISDSPSAEYFFCSKCTWNRFRSVSVYYDVLGNCDNCIGTMSKEVVEESSEAASNSGVFTKHTASFLISNDLQILPKEAGLLQIISVLGITDTDEAKPITVDFGLSEIMNLLKASLTSPTPLSDVILNKTTRMYSPILESQPKEDKPNHSNFILKVMIQNSTGRLLYAQVKENFVEFLFSLLHIPLGGVEHLMGGKTCFKATDNLYRGTADLIDEKYFKCTDTKERLMKPNLANGCISKDHILPLTQEPLPLIYTIGRWSFSSVKFPNGQGIYLNGSQTFEVKDDLTVVPYCFLSILSSLREQKILLSDIKELELNVGLKEALSILKASLTSTSCLTDALLNHKSNNQVKREV